MKPEIVEIQGELWYFPHGCGKGGGAGHKVDRATPIAWPRWVITPAYLPRTTVKVEDIGHVLLLLKLPRNKHD